MSGTWACQRLGVRTDADRRRGLGARGGSDRGDAPALDALDVDQVLLGDRRESAPVPLALVTSSGRSTAEFRGHPCSASAGGSARKLGGPAVLTEGAPRRVV